MSPVSPMVAEGREALSTTGDYGGTEKESYVDLAPQLLLVEKARRVTSLISVCCSSIYGGFV
jgi:hypothetical protein